MSSKKKVQTVTPPPADIPPVAGDTGAPATVPADLSEFDSAIAPSGAPDAAGAAETLRQAEMFATPAPASPEPPKRGRGRPPGARNRGTAPASPSPRPERASVPPSGVAHDRMTKAELIAAIETQEARLAALSPSDVPGVAEITEARKTVEGLLELANFALKLRNVPEFMTTAEEGTAIADAAAEPIAPYLRQLGNAQPWVRLAGTVAIIYAPKVSAYIDRRRAEESGKPAGRTEVLVHAEPSTQRAPSAATMSGGLTP
jgi:hypothetical protein